MSAWAEHRPDVRALALVGSYAAGAPRPDSDIDVVLLTEDPSAYIEHDDWLEDLGAARPLRTRSWGAITERRFALPSGLEVDVGVGTPEWAATDPLDPGTRRVVTDGLRVLHDPDEVLARLVAAC
jgi:hypothetical protein